MEDGRWKMEELIAAIVRQADKGVLCFMGVLMEVARCV